MVNICIFEDSAFDRLYPLSLTRPTFDLLIGMGSNWRRIWRKYPDSSLFLFCREYLAEPMRERVEELNGEIHVNEYPENEEQTLLINGRLLALRDKIPPEGRQELVLCGEIPVYARIELETLQALRESGEPSMFGSREVELLKQREEVLVQERTFKMLDFPWELIDENFNVLVYDFETTADGGAVYPTLGPQVAVYGNRDHLHIGEGTEILGAVTLDIRNGPIYIGEQVEVIPPTVIQGPCYIGDRSTVIGAHVRSKTSIGPVCNVGGEVASSIFHGHSNKSHEGFIGRAYVGEWVNIGANATNSDLKNNYGDVRVPINGKPVSTGKLKVGCFIGDHTKIGIGMLINTGSVYGVNTNLFGSSMPPKFVPSFSWGSGTDLEEYDLDQAIANARKVMGRRNIDLTDASESLLRNVHELHAPHREERGI